MMRTVRKCYDKQRLYIGRKLQQLRHSLISHFVYIPIQIPFINDKHHFLCAGQIPGFQQKDPLYRKLEYFIDEAGTYHFRCLWPTVKPNSHTGGTNKLVCGKITNTHGALMGHVASVHRSQDRIKCPFNRPECPKHFDSIESRDAHLKTVHGG